MIDKYLHLIVRSPFRLYAIRWWHCVTLFLSFLHLSEWWQRYFLQSVTPIINVRVKRIHRPFLLNIVLLSEAHHSILCSNKVLHRILSVMNLSVCRQPAQFVVRSLLTSGKWSWLRFHRLSLPLPVSEPVQWPAAPGLLPSLRLLAPLPGI